MVTDYHLAVLQKETIESVTASLILDKNVLLEKKSNHPMVFVDCTLGGGGHFFDLLFKLDDFASQLTQKQIVLIAFDKDLDAIARVQDKINKVTKRQNITIHICHRSFSELKEVLDSLQLSSIDGLIADFGVSSHQLDSGSRGFSIRNDGPLDMRMDQTDKVTPTAKEILETYSEQDLVRIFRDYGEVKEARSIARAIVKDREINKLPLSSSLEFAEFIKRVRGGSHKKVHPATQIFQALRIEVNQELSDIKQLLNLLPQFFSKTSIFGFITFHSLEDRIVKKFLRAWEKGIKNLDNIEEANEILFLPTMHDPLGKEYPRGGIAPSEEEIARNPRSRSARLRVFHCDEIRR